LFVPIIGAKHVIAEDGSERKVVEVDSTQAGLLNPLNRKSYFGGFQVVTSRESFRMSLRLTRLREIAQRVRDTAVSGSPEYEASHHIANA
jgi:hypothetical protein